MKLEEMKVRINALLEEIAERYMSCLNDGWNYNQLTALLNIVEDQLAGKTHAGYNIKYGRVWYSSYPHAREEVMKFFPRMVRNYEGEV